MHWCMRMSILMVAIGGRQCHGYPTVRVSLEFYVKSKILNPNHYFHAKIVKVVEICQSTKSSQNLFAFFKMHLITGFPQIPLPHLKRKLHQGVSRIKGG